MHAEQISEEQCAPGQVTFTTAHIAQKMGLLGVSASRACCGDEMGCLDCNLHMVPLWWMLAPTPPPLSLF